MGYRYLCYPGGGPSGSKLESHRTYLDVAKQTRPLVDSRSTCRVCVLSSTAEIACRVFACCVSSSGAMRRLHRSRVSIDTERANTRDSRWSSIWRRARQRLSVKTARPSGLTATRDTWRPPASLIVHYGRGRCPSVVRMRNGTARLDDNADCDHWWRCLRAKPPPPPHRRPSTDSRLVHIAWNQPAQWSSCSKSECGARGPRFKSHRGWLCFTTINRTTQPPALRGTRNECGQITAMLCGCGVKAGWLIPCV